MFRACSRACRQHRHLAENVPGVGQTDGGEEKSSCANPNLGLASFTIVTTRILLVFVYVHVTVPPAAPAPRLPCLPTSSSPPLGSTQTSLVSDTERGDRRSSVTPYDRATDHRTSVCKSSVGSASSSS